MTSSLRDRIGAGIPIAGVLAMIGAMSLAPVGGLASAAPAPMPADAPTELSLSATGEVEVAPDIAVLQMGVSAMATTGAEAIRLNRERMNAAITTLKASGVAGKDIQTAGFSLNPQYAYETNKPPRLTGYVASNTVSAIVRDIGRAGSVIDAVTASGANQINVISFDISDRQKAEDEALRRAVKALQDRAELYAAATGLHVQRLTRLSEGSSLVAAAPLQRVFATARMAEPAPTAVEPGELRVRISVDAAFALQR